MHWDLLSSRYYTDNWLSLDEICKQHEAELQYERDMLEAQLRWERINYGRFNGRTLDGRLCCVNTDYVNTNICETTCEISHQIVSHEKPFKIIYKSKPIKGIILELYGKNPNYNWEGEYNIC